MKCHLAIEFTFCTHSKHSFSISIPLMKNRKSPLLRWGFSADIILITFCRKVQKSACSRRKYFNMQTTDNCQRCYIVLSNRCDQRHSWVITLCCFVYLMVVHVHHRSVCSVKGSQPLTLLKFPGLFALTRIQNRERKLNASSKFHNDAIR